MTCAECGATADAGADGWQAHRADLPDDTEPPQLAFYCPDCAAREFEP